MVQGKHLRYVDLPDQKLFALPLSVHQDLSLLLLSVSERLPSVQPKADLLKGSCYLLL